MPSSESAVSPSSKDALFYRPSRDGHVLTTALLHALDDTIIEAKDGRLTLKQKALKWDETNTALRELLAFTDYLCDSSTTTPLTEIPKAHLPLIAKFTIESDKSAAVLAKHIKKTILKKCGAEDDKKAADDPRLPIQVVTSAVSEVASRVNYGVQDTPAALAVWRWELKNPEDMLPDSGVDGVLNAAKAVERRKDRENAQIAFKAHYETLNEEQRKALLEKQKKGANATKDTSTETAPSLAASGSKPKKEAKTSKAASKEAPKDDSPTKTAPEPKKNEKQAKMMMSFFKTAPSKPKVVAASKPASSSNDFERVFKPFLLRKDTSMASINFFLDASSKPRSVKGKERAEVIILDDEGDVEMTIEEPASSPVKEGRSKAGEVDVSDSRSILNAFLSTIPKSRLLRSPSAPSPSKRVARLASSLSVRTLVAKLNEAEVSDDVKEVQRLEALLKNRRRLPMKYLQFCDNLRPGYYGTWTKTSAFVGPRKPFAKDPVTFDYSYDSGEEWEEEPEDAEEVASDAGEDEEADSPAEEDEFDDWLVGDDEVEFEEGAEQSRSASPTSALGTALKRKLDIDKEKDKDKEPKKRKIVQLVPFVTGPHWEQRIGACVDHLQNFRIQLLNDTPFPIDPFTFISEPTPVSTSDPAAPSAGLRVPAATKGDVTMSSDGFAIPALPPHLHPSTQINRIPPTPETDTPLKTAKAKPPKKPFPAQHVPQLMQSVEGSKLTKLHLIEQLGIEFKGHKEVKKYAIEGMLTEIASRVGGTWKVKDEVWTKHGIPRPTAVLD